MCEPKEEIILAECPTGFQEIGSLGSDIAGFGLENCNDRYGEQANSPNDCANHCSKHAECRSFTWAPMDGDINHPGKKVCTIYDNAD